MKRFHECAVVKDGNKRVGYYITECQNASDAINSGWCFVDSNTFENLVKSNQVQYLVLDNGTIKCRYTDEERSYLINQLHVKNDYIKSTENNYFALDVQFNARHIYFTDKMPVVACSLGEIVSVLGMKIFVLMIIGQASTLSILYNELISMFPSLQGQIKYQYGNNVMSICMSKMILDQFLASTSVGVLISASSFKSRQSLNAKIGVKFMRRPNDNYADKVYNYVDSINASTIGRFGININ